MRQRRAQLELITHNQTKGKGKTQYTEHGSKYVSANKTREFTTETGGMKTETRLDTETWRQE